MGKALRVNKLCLYILLCNHHDCKHSNPQSTAITSGHYDLMASHQAGPSRSRALEPLRGSSIRSTRENSGTINGRSNAANASKAFIPLRPKIRANESLIDNNRQSSRASIQRQNSETKALEPLPSLSRKSGNDRKTRTAGHARKSNDSKAYVPIGSKTALENTYSPTASSKNARQDHQSFRKRALEPIRPNHVHSHPQKKEEESEDLNLQAKKRTKALEPIQLRPTSMSNEKKKKSETCDESKLESTEKMKIRSGANYPLRSSALLDADANKGEASGIHRSDSSNTNLFIKAHHVKKEESKISKSRALQPLQRSHKQPMDQVFSMPRTFAALDHPRHAIKILCYDLQRMRSCTNKNKVSLGTYSHLQRETVFVHLVGRIVGVEEKDHKVKWLIDDGSAVIAAHHAYDPRPPAVQQREEVTKPDKGKRRAVEENLGIASGIPSEYIRPPAPVKNLKKESKTDAILRATILDQKFEHTYQHLSVCSLVSLVGRVDSWFQGEMIVQVDRIIPPGSKNDLPTIRAPREGFIELLNNPNLESEHITTAIALAMTEYLIGPDHPTSIKASLEGPSASKKVAVKEITATEGNDEVRVKNDLQPSSKRKAEGKAEGIEPDNGRSNETDGNAESGAEIDEVSEKTIPSNALVDRGIKQRRMRDFRKIPDRQLNDQLLRIYVQKHISDHCRQSYDAGESENQKRGVMPPTFTINYLQRVTTLRLLADRVVDVALKKREAKRRKIDRLSAKSLIAISTSRDIGKRERLFESVIRNMVADGMVVVSDGKKDPPLAPFDGVKPKEEDNLLRLGQDRLLDWEDVHQDHPNCKFTQTIVSGDFVTAKQMQTEKDNSILHWRGSHKAGQMKDQEVYQLVTPELLAKPICELLGVKADNRKNMTYCKGNTDENVRICEAINALSPYKIKERINSLDDRWRFIRTESVSEAIVYLQNKASEKMLNLVKEL